MLLDYLFQVSQWMLPHLINRPVSLVRCPQGITGQRYYQKHAQAGFPVELQRIDLPDEEQPFLAINSLSGLLSTAQLSAIELHPWNCLSTNPETPDRVIFDLDPDEQVAWSQVIDAAITIRKQLQKLKLRAWLKTSGGKGLHVVVPLAHGTSWDDAFNFTKQFAEQLARQQPAQFVATMSKAARRGRIFIDYHRNRRGATAVAAYSVRARPGAPVSTPSLGKNCRRSPAVRNSLY